MRSQYSLARPHFPKPNCRVRLVCGPPASGKSTYVNKNSSPDDIVIDLDTIAREQGYGRERPAYALEPLLQIRNERLASLAKMSKDRVAWVILTAPSKALRAWWRTMLGVSVKDQVVLVPTRTELRQRIFKDPDRPGLRVKMKHMEIVDKWFERERTNNPGVAMSGCDEDGWPSDPLHFWNREDED